MRKVGGLELEEINYAKTGLDEATVRGLVGKAGSVAAVLNGRHATAKTRGWNDTPPDVATFARAVAREPNLLRRPIVIAGRDVIVGYDKSAYRKLG